jgi:glycosyltransferase involved in cell wall biosynthesis
MSAYWGEARAHPRTLAGATILQILPALDDDAVGRGAVHVAYTLLQSGARAIIAGEGGALVSELQAFGGEWLPLARTTLNPLALRRNAQSLAHFIGMHRVDVVHAYSAAAAAGAVTATARMPVWLVGSLPDAPTSASWADRVHERALAKADRVVATSQSAASAFLRRYNIPPDRLTVIPRSVDIGGFDPASVSAGRVAAMRRAWGVQPGQRVVLVPSGSPRDQAVAIAAARLLVERGLRGTNFVLIDDTRRHKTINRAARKAGVDAFVYPGAPPRDPAAAYAAAHTVVIAGKSSPPAIRQSAQAQAMARPVVTSEVGALPESVLAPPRMPDALRTGWVVRPGDPHDLARAVEVSLLLDRAAYQALAARARQFAEFMFAPRSVAAATRAVYTALLARDR